MPDETAGTATCACSGIRRAGRALTNRYDEALAPSGLRVTQYALLSRLERLGPVAVGRLAEEMALDRTALTRTLAPLRRDGLVADAAGEDRRTRLVALTTAGTAAMAAARPLWREAQSRLTAGFGAERLATLLAELAAVEVAATGIGPAAGPLGGLGTAVAAREKLAGLGGPIDCADRGRDRGEASGRRREDHPVG